jgi:hypothetical protein
MPNADGLFARLHLEDDPLNLKGLPAGGFGRRRGLRFSARSGDKQNGNENERNKPNHTVHIALAGVVLASQAGLFCGFS